MFGFFVLFKVFFFHFCCPGNLIALNFGAAFSWGSIAFEELQKDSTLLPTGVLTLNEASLMVSVMSVGGLIGNVLSPVIGEKYGHKQTILWLGVPQAVSVENIKKKLY